MSNICKVIGSLIIAMLVLVLWSPAGQSQDERGPGRLRGDAAQPHKEQSGAQEPRLTSEPAADEEKLVRDLYARLMRYQSAAVDEQATKADKASAPDDYLTFELRAIHSGPITELYGKPLNELVTPRSGALIDIKPTYLSGKGGTVHAYYEAQWVNTDSTASKLVAPKYNDAGAPASGPILRGGGKRYAGVTRYTAYEVTVQFQGQQRTYRALILYRLKEGEHWSDYRTEEERLAKLAKVEVLDEITAELNKLLVETSPRARAPWDKYVKSNVYLAVGREVRQKHEAGQPLIPANAPIGYLPGDDATPNKQDALVLAADACLTTTVSITINGVANADKSTIGGLLVLNSDSNNAPRQQITIGQAQPASYTGNVTLTRNNTKVKVFTAATGGTEITFNGIDNRFPNSTLPKSLYVEGAAFSDGMRDVTLQVASDDAPPATDSVTFTVLWVDQPTVSFSGPVDPSNAARSAYVGWTTAGTDQLGLQTYNNNFIARLGWGVQISAIVHPNAFDYPHNDLKLDKDLEFNDWFDNGSSLLGSRNFSATIPPGNDTDSASIRDDDPKPNGIIYDLDAPGLVNTDSAPQNQIRRTRNHFKSFASITVSGTAVRCSKFTEWFVRFSMMQTAAPSGTNWVVVNPPDVTGDNQAATGTTPLSWNLH